ncbi:uncharacterized protein UV8b_07985 [Ustilaginoidea virens]|uniref:Zn(2)-C6 fungal-type domain-containing protein n=1 Tax=Ustilaginoidea virens TaxID=1159556 RepID=A0A8E5HYW9_USTVR|nr:uncharacterized protein UV8b_07985 [Ustilaginoidea virens]QUC23744.1 hypothetical protein UV8b_07985 [Ustilaginoidea virens]
MEQIETQASDLRYLAEAPVMLSDTPSASYGTPRPGVQASPSSGSAHAGYGDNSAAAASGGHGAAGSAANTRASASASAGKRKSFDDGEGAEGASAQKQTRSKRNRYISIACNECKRRKIKCNGETPCQRCGNLNLACLYAPNCCSSSFKDSDEFRTLASQLARLREEVDGLSQAVKTMQSADPGRLAPLATDRAPSSGGLLLSLEPSPAPTYAPPAPLARPGPGPFRGSTSLAFSLDVANNTIANMGYSEMEESDDQDPQGGSDTAPRTMLGPGFDPLLGFDKDEMVRLCELYEDELGIMYPVVNIHTVIAHARSIAPFLDSIRNHERPPEGLNNDNKTLQLKMVMCSAQVVESHGHSERAVELYESMETVVNRKLMSDASEVANLPLLCLLAGYRFVSNEEVLAWRVMGQVMRLCLELGLHQKSGLTSIPDESERRDAINSFWSAYVLDRRWAFGTGLPFAVHDDEIDPNLPLPAEFPVLVSMITYSRISAKVWRHLSHFGPVLAREVRQEEIETLDREILQWYETIPEEVKLRSWDKEKQIASMPSYNLQRLSIWAYLRLNQIRIWLYTPILHSATSIMQHPAKAQTAVDLSSDTIQFLSHLNSADDLYRRTQVLYNHFLASAISVVFLASVHAPVRFSAVCRKEFYLALGLVKNLSAKSWVSKRLWRTIKSLKNIAPRFGLDPDDDAHSSAALGMMGLARGHADGMPAAQPPFSLAGMSASQQNQSQDQHKSHHPAGPQQEDQNGRRIQGELSRIYEGYVGLNGFQFGGAKMPPPPHADLGVEAAGLCAPDGTVFLHLREMF